MIGSRIKSARLMSGLSLRQLGDAVGVSHAAIRKYELGDSAPGSDILTRIARAVSMPIDYFFREQTSYVVSLRFRDEHRLGPRQRDRVLAETEDWLERYLAAQSLISPIFDDQTLPRIFTVRACEDVEDAAIALRKEWQLGIDPIASLVQAMEDRGVRVHLVGNCSGFEALSFVVPGVGPCAVVCADVPGDRQRFSLGHELGHLVLNIQEPDLIEPSCQRFASALLVPREAAVHELGQHRSSLNYHELYLLKHKYGMSMRAWIIRAKQLGIVEPDWAAHAQAEFAQNGWDRKEPGQQLAPEFPIRLEQLVFSALQEQSISYSRAGELLRCSPEQARKKSRSFGTVSP